MRSKYKTTTVAATGLLLAGLASPASAIHLWVNPPVEVDGFTVTGPSWSADIGVSGGGPDLIGYTLAIRIVPLSGSTGSLTIDTAGSGFESPRHVFTAAGIPMDPAQSHTIFNPERVLALASTLGGVPVQPIEGANDVLFHLSVQPSEDASGYYLFIFEPSTALYGPGGVQFPFDSPSVTLYVVPAPATLAPFAGLFAMARRRR